MSVEQAGGPPGSPGLLSRLAGPFREFGPGVGLLYLVDRVLRAVSGSLGLYLYELMVQPIGDKPLLPKGLTRNLRMAEIGRDHPDMAALAARPEIKQARLDRGSVCLATYRKEVMIGTIWFGFRSYDEDEVRCRYVLEPADRSVFDFDLYVPPEHRLGVAFAAVWDGANRYLRERGVAYSFSRVSRFNSASRRSHAHFGWKRAALAAILKLGPVELLLADVKPYVALSWRAAQRPQLHLTADVLATPASPPPQP